MVSTAGLSCSAAGSLLKWTAATGTNVKVITYRSFTLYVEIVQSSVKAGLQKRLLWLL